MNLTPHKKRRYFWVIWFVAMALVLVLSATANGAVPMRQFTKKVVTTTTTLPPVTIVIPTNGTPSYPTSVGVLSWQSPATTVSNGWVPVAVSTNPQLPINYVAQGGCVLTQSNQLVWTTSTTCTIYANQPNAYSITETLTKK